VVNGRYDTSDRGTPQPSLRCLGAPRSGQAAEGWLLPVVLPPCFALFIQVEVVRLRLHLIQLTEDCCMSVAQDIGFAVTIRSHKDMQDARISCRTGAQTRSPGRITGIKFRCPTHGRVV